MLRVQAISGGLWTCFPEKLYCCGGRGVQVGAYLIKYGKSLEDKNN